MTNEEFLNSLVAFGLIDNELKEQTSWVTEEYSLIDFCKKFKECYLVNNCESKDYEVMIMCLNYLHYGYKDDIGFKLIDLCYKRCKIVKNRDIKEIFNLFTKIHTDKKELYLKWVNKFKIITIDGNGIELRNGEVYTSENVLINGLYGGMFYKNKEWEKIRLKGNGENIIRRLVKLDYDVCMIPENLLEFDIIKRMNLSNKSILDLIILTKLDKINDINLEEFSNVYGSKNRIVREIIKGFGLNNRIKLGTIINISNALLNIEEEYIEKAIVELKLKIYKLDYMRKSEILSDIANKLNAKKDRTSEEMIRIIINYR